jgi:hypothetical protein
VKKHLSVLMLFIRSTLYKFLLIVLFMAVVQGMLFSFAFKGAEGYYGLDTVLAASHLGIVCAVCFLMLCALLCLAGCNFGSKQSYTLARLRVSLRSVFIWQSIHNAGILFLFWAAECGIILAFCSVYITQNPQPQATMLVFYQNAFLHNLFPLADWSRHVYNIVLLASLATSMACFPIRIRRRQKPLASFVITAVCILSFRHEMGSLGVNICLSFVVAFIAVMAVRGIWKELDYAGLS